MFEKKNLFFSFDINAYFSSRPLINDPIVHASTRSSVPLIEGSQSMAGLGTKLVSMLTRDSPVRGTREAE